MHPMRLPDRLYRIFDPASNQMDLMEAVRHAGGTRKQRRDWIEPAVLSYGQTLSYCMPDDERQQLIPLVPWLVGVCASPSGFEIRQVRILADVAVRVFTPLALDAADLRKEARRLRSLPEIVDRATADRAETEAAG